MKSERWEVVRFALDAAVCIACVLTFIVLILVISRNPDSYGAVLSAKIERLKSAPSPRVVFVGGSGTAFGVDSVTVRKMTGLNPINLGMYAGFGIEHMLNQAASGVRSGDIVVIIPEYSVYSASTSAVGFYVLESMQNDPRFVRFALSNSETVLNSVREFPTWFSTRVYSLFGRITDPIFPRPDSVFRRVYRASKFNEFGDNDGALTESSRLPGSEISTSSAAAFAAPINAGNLNVINAFIKQEEARGAHVYVSWPALPRTLERMAHEKLTVSEKQISDTFGSHILGTQADFIFDDTDFFDTINHLAPEARTERSITLSKLILTSMRRTTAGTP